MMGGLQGIKIEACQHRKAAGWLGEISEVAYRHESLELADAGLNMY